MIKSKAPLRIGLAGGGTDVSPYSDLHGGAVLNATINLYSYASLEPLSTGTIEFVDEDSGQSKSFASQEQLPITEGFELYIGVYNRIVKDYAKKALSFKLSTHLEAPRGSGLGTSSTLVVAILGVFIEWLQIPLEKSEIARLAFDIERKDLNFSGGKQDQYAATYGGINFIEFSKEGPVFVKPVPLTESFYAEFESSLLLYYTKTQRHSADIINEQVNNVKNNNLVSIQAMHNLKEQAEQLKKALEAGNEKEIGEVLNFGWKNKKEMANAISNTLIDDIYKTARSNGASGGKISGAGGGGFMMFYCPNNNKQNVAKALESFGGTAQVVKFTKQGLITWNT